MKFILDYIDAAKEQLRELKKYASFGKTVQGRYKSSQIFSRQPKTSGSSNTSLYFF